NEGVLDDGPIDEPSAEQLDAAIDALRAEFPEPDVLLYLRTLAAQDNTAWPGLAERLDEWDARPPPTPQGPAPRPRAARGGRAAPESAAESAASAPEERPSGGRKRSRATESAAPSSASDRARPPPDAHSDAHTPRAERATPPGAPPAAP